MKKIYFILFMTLVFITTACQNPDPVKERSGRDSKIIFVYGNGMQKQFISYVIELTGKSEPTVCFIPTAAADNRLALRYWDQLCSDLPLKSDVLMTFINSSPEQRLFEEQIMHADAIIVGGGNTLNMLAIWKAQGIDTLLRQAYEKGTVLAGGSAGSLCWFTGGYTDSRPKELTLMDCLGFLDYSHCPHYNSNPERKSLYRNAIREGKLSPGYACDDGAGLLFINGKMVRSVSLREDQKNYFVSLENGEIHEELLPAEILN